MGVPPAYSMNAVVLMIISDIKPDDITITSIAASLLCVMNLLEVISLAY